MSRVAALLLALVLLVLGACVRGVPGPAQPITDPQVALESLDHSMRALSSVRAEARVDQRGRQGRVRGTVLMFVERGERVRFDVMTQFGPIAILTSDRAQFAYADLREKRYLVGETCPENIARLLGVPLSVDETSRFLTGGTPVLSAAKRSIAWHEDGFYRVVLSGQDESRQELDLGIFDEDRGRPAGQQRLYLLRSELYAPDGSRIWRVTYREQQPMTLEGQTLSIPHRVRVEQPRTGSDTLIHFKEIKLNPQIPPEAFVQEPRPGMAVEIADCE